MKILFAFLLVLLAASASFAEPNDEPSQSGRYQLCVGKLDLFWPDSPTKFHEETVNSVFRIDTVTGKTWYLQRTAKKFKDGLSPNQTWVLIEE
jgi:hypothetical protein